MYLCALFLLLTTHTLLDNAAALQVGPISIGEPTVDHHKAPVTTPSTPKWTTPTTSKPKTTRTTPKSHLGSTSNPCNIKCSPFDESLVWGIADGICLPLQNGCYHAKESCERSHEGLDIIKLVPKSECQKKCAKVSCYHHEHKPVCAAFVHISLEKGTKIEWRTFDNTLKLEAFACLHAKAFLHVLHGTCVALSASGDLNINI